MKVVKNSMVVFFTLAAANTSCREWLKGNEEAATTSESSPSESAETTDSNNDTNINVKVDLWVNGETANASAAGEDFDLSAEAAQAGALNLSSIKIAAAGGTPSDSMKISGDKFGTEIPLVAKLPKDFSGNASSLELGLDLTSDELKLAGIAEQKLTGFTVAKPKVPAKENGTAEISLSSTLAMKLLKKDDGMPISMDVSEKSFEELKVAIEKIQSIAEKDVNPNVKTDVANIVHVVLVGMTGKLVSSAEFREHIQEKVKAADPKAEEKFSAKVRELKYEVSKAVEADQSIMAQVLKTNSDTLAEMNEVKQEVESDPTYEQEFSSATDDHNNGSGSSAGGGSGGGGSSSTANVVVVPDISYTTAAFSFRQNVALTEILVVNQGGAIASCSVIPSLPAGLSLNAANCSISGTPTTVASASSFTVTATNASGSDSFQISLEVLPPAPSISFSGSPFSFVVGQLISTATPANSGGAISSCAISALLPAGLSFNTTTCAISGTPTSGSSSQTFVVTATNAGGSDNDNITIEVVSAPSISFSPSSYSFQKGIPITNISVANSGGNISSCTVTSGTLPAGLTLSSLCVISGTPTTAASSVAVTIRGTNAAGNGSATVNIAITATIDGGTNAGLNMTTSKNAALYSAGATATTSNGDLFVGWGEEAEMEAYQDTMWAMPRIKKYSGGTWTGVAGDQIPNNSTFNPHLVDLSANMIMPKAHSAYGPMLAAIGNKVYATFGETSWTNDGDRNNFTGTYSSVWRSNYQRRVRLAVYDNAAQNPSWTFLEDDATLSGGAPAKTLNYAVPGSDGTGGDGETPAIVAFGNKIVVTWLENGTVRAKSYDVVTEQWQSFDAIPTSVSQEHPLMTVALGKVFVSTKQQSTQYVRVFSWDGASGTQWQAVVPPGSPGSTCNCINSNDQRSTGRASLIGNANALYMAWPEARNQDPWVNQMRVRKFDGTNWTWLTAGATDTDPGMNLVDTQNAYDGQLQLLGADLYIAYSLEQRVRLARYSGSGTSWVYVDGGSPTVGLNYYSNSQGVSGVNLTPHGTGLMVNWSESDGSRSTMRAYKYQP